MPGSILLSSAAMSREGAVSVWTGATGVTDRLLGACGVVEGGREKINPERVQTKNKESPMEDKLRNANALRDVKAKGEPPK